MPLNAQNSRPLRDQLRILEGIQELDLNIESLQKKKDALPAQLKLMDLECAKFVAERDQKTKLISELDKTRLQISNALELNEERLKRTQARIGGVANTREYQAASKEVTQLQEFIQTLTQQKTENTQALDTLKTAVATLAQQIEQTEARKSEEQGKIQQSLALIATELDRLKVEREILARDIEKRVMAPYDRVRSRRNGLGVVPTEGGHCKGCNMGLPPQMVNQIIKGNDLVACPSCHRLLYAPGTGSVTTTQSSVV